MRNTTTRQSPPSTGLCMMLRSPSDASNSGLRLFHTCLAMAILDTPHTRSCFRFQFYGFNISTGGAPSRSGEQLSSVAASWPSTSERVCLIWMALLRPESGKPDVEMGGLRTPEFKDDAGGLVGDRRRDATTESTVNLRLSQVCTLAGKLGIRT